MNLLDFFKKYPTEQSCKDAFKAKRLAEGVKCRKCGGLNHYWKKNREQWECKKCTHRTTLRSGTVMEHSKLPFQYWFIAMHLLTCTKKSFSAKEIQNQLGHNRYEPIWAMLHKIRSVMGLRDEKYVLNGNIELDDGFFSTVSITDNKTEPLKRGRGSQKKTAVLIATESDFVEDEEVSKKYSTGKKLGYIKMHTLLSLKKADTNRIVKKVLKTGVNILTDGSTSYVDFEKRFNHTAEVISKEEISKKLPWVHIIISNAKRLLLNTHHRVDADFLQNYLNEFVYKLNRRYVPNIFENILTAAVSYRWDYLGEISG